MRNYFLFSHSQMAEQESAGKRIMAKKMGLGRGLSAILPDVEDVVEAVEGGYSGIDAVMQIRPGDIDPNQNQPRKRFDGQSLQQLADSIKQSGVLSPILVAKNGNRYTIIAGERRWRAAMLANMQTIPAIVRDWDEIKRREAALIENMQREDLNPIEEAQGIEALMNECAMTQEAVAEKLGRSRPAIANLLRLLHLPKDMQDAVADGALSAGHARVLAGVEDNARRRALFEMALRMGWSVRRLEEEAKRLPAKKPVREKTPLPAEYGELTERLRMATGLRVTLDGTQKKGKIVLQYDSEEDLQRVWDWLENT